IIVLRERGGEHARGFRMPGVPYLPLAAITANAALAVFMYALHPAAWLMALIWVVTGMLAYYLYIAPRAARELPREVVFEEIEASGGYTVLVPVNDRHGAAQMGMLAALIAKAARGNVTALNVIAVPRPLALGHGRALLERRETLLERVGEGAAAQGVPVHSLIRMGRDVAEAVRKTAVELDAELLLLDWPGYTRSRGRVLGSIIDTLWSYPPCDMAIVHPCRMEKLRTILVPVKQTANSRLAVRLAAQVAHATGAVIILLHIVKSKAEQEGMGAQFWEPLVEGLSGVKFERRVEAGRSVVHTVQDAAQDADLVVIGAASSPWWRHVIVGSIPKRIAIRTNRCCMITRARPPAVALLARHLLRPP
ncbi:MAG: universal stress protein, partial [Candidatus Binatia bacterium]